MYVSDTTSGRCDLLQISVILPSLNPRQFVAPIVDCEAGFYPRILKRHPHWAICSLGVFTVISWRCKGLPFSKTAELLAYWTKPGSERALGSPHFLRLFFPFTKCFRSGRKITCAGHRLGRGRPDGATRRSWLALLPRWRPGGETRFAGALPAQRGRARGGGRAARWGGLAPREVPLAAAAGPAPLTWAAAQERQSRCHPLLRGWTGRGRR